MNGGTCHDDTAHHHHHGFKYKCECRKGFIGHRCESETQTCDDNPCRHGTCHDTLSGFKCECPLGFSGAKCEIKFNECDSSPCHNGGKCRPKGNYLFQCECPSGFMGSRCEENIDDCQGNPCANGGTCVDEVNQFRCVCVPGFVGTLCNSTVDLCLTKPCANGGTCKSINNDYKCQCRAGFTGKDCSTDIDECASQPCRNGATCINRVNSFRCVCPGGYRGAQCEDEAYATPWRDGSLTKHSVGSLHSEGRSDEEDNLSKAQIALIVILSVAMPAFVIVAAMVVICMKRRRKREQEKDDAEARKQNEQNASHTISHLHNAITLKRGATNASIGGLDSSHHNMIKNTWDKSVNNIASSISVDECLMNSSMYSSALSSAYSDNAANDCNLSQIPPLQRARSQKQLNTDPLIKNRASQIVTPKEFYNPDAKRISLLSDGSLGCHQSTGTTTTAPRWGGGCAGIPINASPTRQLGHCSPPHM